MTTIAQAAWLLGLVLTMLWLALCQRLFTVLKNRHPEAFVALGSPHFFLNNTPRHSFLLLGFIFGDAGRAIPDASLQTLLRVMRILFPTILLLYAAFVSLMFFTLPPSP